MLEIKNLIKTYNKSDFELSIPQFTVNAGSITGLVGPNGAGKTTLLKLIAGLLYPDHGQICLMGQNKTENTVIKNISYMPGQKSLYGHMAVRQMLDFARSTVFSWNNDKTKILLDRFPLKMDKKISTLSYGERTQLYIILTFSSDLPFLVLDEPTGGLDPVMQERLLSLIKEESGQGKTILFSSHQLNEIEETADTIAIIKSGRIVISGIIDDLKQKLYLIVTNKVLDTANLNIVAQRREGDKTILLGIKDEVWVSSEFPSMNVNLKDIFLNVIEGEAAHEFIY